MFYIAQTAHRALPTVAAMEAARVSEASHDDWTARANTHSATRLWFDRAVKLKPLWDFISLLCAGMAANLLCHVLSPNSTLGEHVWNECQTQIIVTSLLGALFFRLRGVSRISDRNSIIKLIRGFTVQYVIFAAVLLALGFASRTLDHLSRLWVFVDLSSAYFLMLFVRFALKGRYAVRQIAVIGSGPVADRLIHHLRNKHDQGLRFIGLFDDRSGRTAGHEFKPSGTVDDLIKLNKQHNIEWTLITLPCTAEGRLLSILRKLNNISLTVGLCPQNIGLKIPYSDVDYVASELPVSLLADRPIKRWHALLKNTEDLLLGGFITLILSPLMLIVVLAIKFDSPGPVMFRQRRHAWNNCEFDVYKFRTMSWASNLTTEAPLQQTSRDDQRITRVGRFLRRTSLDELPQLINVLKGQMSLVGPRPHAINMRTETRLGHEIIDTYAHRHRVKPGITGWAQVHGFRGATQTTYQLRRRIELDLEYIDRWSLWLDLKILALTSWVVIRGTNAY